ncbi:hypothetical protein LCGC14_0648540 [marine sediment metagenome]|uniref:Uncharacterized protein n=1 Tax=marine sediment metagenome TaxID=412755 RepID=A0A0F9TIT3_9ZZZZ
MNRFFTKYYAGFPTYSEVKFSWTRINVPQNGRDEPIFLLRKENLHTSIMVH